MRNSSQKGFTLIELIVVIVILGILASFAVPKFMGVEREARIASLNALAGTLRSSAAMAHGLQMAQGLSANTSITVEGNPIAMSNGYPTRANLVSLIQDMSGFTYTANTGVFVKAGAPNAACAITYNNAVAPAAPVITVPAAATLAASC